jgi:protein CpxP
MTMKSTSVVAAVAASLVLPAVALTSGAFAQSQSSTPTEAPAGAPTTVHKPMAQAKSASPTERVEQHISQLHSELHITPAQQTEWDQFAQVMRDNAKAMDQLLQQRAAGFASMNAVDNMQSYAQIAQQHAQDTQKLATAFQTLYSDMSDSQKKNADAVFRARGEHSAHRKG